MNTIKHQPHSKASEQARKDMEQTGVKPLSKDKVKELEQFLQTNRQH